MVQFDENDFEKAYDEEIDRINEQLEKEIIFAMIGDVNTGKSSTINRLVGEEVASVGAQPGETVIVKKYKYKDKIIFADTPGLDDINSKNSEETEKYVKKADVILFFLNAAGTVFSEGEKTQFDKISKINKNIIFVMNKIDAAEDISSLVKYVQDMTGFNYRVEPISSKTGEGIDRLRKAIMDILKKESKDILFAKSIKEKSSTANNWILAAAASAAGIGAVPLPGADIIPLTGIQVALMLRLATLYEKPISKDRAKELILSSLTGSLGKTIFRQAVKLIPGAGSVAAGGVAGSLTLGLGFAVKYAYENNIELDADILNSLTSIFKKQKPIFEGASI